MREEHAGRPAGCLAKLHSRRPQRAGLSSPRPSADAGGPTRQPRRQRRDLRWRCFHERLESISASGCQVLTRNQILGRAPNPALRRAGQRPASQMLALERRGHATAHRGALLPRRRRNVEGGGAQADRRFLGRAAAAARASPRRGAQGSHGIVRPPASSLKGGKEPRQPEPPRRPGLLPPHPAWAREESKRARAAGGGQAVKMAEAPASPVPLSPLEVELDPEFEPQSRPRSCTWPLQRPELQASPAKPSGETAADSMIPEEDDDEDDEDGGGRASSAMVIGGGLSSTLGSGLLLEDSARLLAPGGQDLGSGPASATGALSGGPQTPLQPQQPLAPQQPGAAGGSGQPRKCSSRRNAWGNLSYADLITRAIESSPDKRLTLSQIYEWMVRCVPYFKDKGDSNSSAGWKVGTYQGLVAGPARHVFKRVLARPEKG
ncbi:hypothetical protein NN561_017704 [Cricetulus griseus]